LWIQLQKKNEYLRVRGDYKRYKIRSQEGNTTMLQTYNAEINGSQLTWLDTPPQMLSHQRVRITLADSKPTAQPTHRYDFSDLVGRLKWRGDAVAEQRAIRNEW
jgi:hypothetical protein